MKDRGKVVLAEAETLEDLCRLSSSFDSNSEPLFYDESKGMFYFFVERSQSAALAIAVKKRFNGGKLIYSPGTTEREEKALFSDEEREGFMEINVIRFKSTNFQEKKSFNAEAIEVVNPESLLKEAIRRGAMNETILHLYSFTINKRRAIGSFEIMEGSEKERPVFLYSFLDLAEPMPYARYDYSSKKIEFSYNTGEHNYLYAKIINLKRMPIAWK
ncbi:MAG: hypothetical protein QXL16_01905 [Candidatus Micrarchaeaceae archaeon]